jgi:hypothetical protein
MVAAREAAVAYWRVMRSKGWDSMVARRELERVVYKRRVVVKRSSIVEEEGVKEVAVTIGE